MKIPNVRDWSLGQIAALWAGGGLAGVLLSELALSRARTFTTATEFRGPYEPDLLQWALIATILVIIPGSLLVISWMWFTGRQR